MKRYYGAIILLFVINHLLLVNVYATENGYSPYIFKVKARCHNQDIPGCSNELTGFISREFNGIITALHGVVKRNSINVYNRDYEFLGLKIDKVDFNHDIALITSDYLKDKIKEKSGLNFLRRSYSNKDYEGLYTIGYPVSLIEQLRSDNLSVRIPPRKKINDLLTSDTRGPLYQRKSPDINLEAISLEGHLQPGHSGGPILNKNNEVIGIANGGLKDGAAGICWAVPYNEINLVSKSLKEKELSSLSIEGSAFFSFTSVVKISESESLVLQLERKGEAMDWSAAQEYAKRMNREALEGCSDWRVPAKVELQKIAQIIKKHPSGYPDVYTDKDDFYWSSEDESMLPYAWAVHLGSGEKKIYSTKEKLYVWLVRNY